MTSSRASSIDNSSGWLSRLDESGLLPERYTLVDAENASLRLRGPDGVERECTDLMSAYAAVNFGHRNPAIGAGLGAVSDVAALFQVAAAEDVARWLCTRLGDENQRRVLYQVGGSFAVATALALARRYRPGRIMAIEGAFHGLGVDTGVVSDVHRDLMLQDAGLSAMVAGEVVHISPGSIPANWEGASCLIYEPVQGANGYVPLEPRWLTELVRSARAAGVITIADEIQCGYFRHGTLSPSTAMQLDADILLFGKSLTNGVYPLSAVVYRRFLERGLRPVYLAHTFQTGTLGPLAAKQVCRYIDDRDIPAMAAAVEGQLRDLADDLVREELARELYVTGPTLSFQPVTVPSRELVRRCFADQVLVFSGGRHGQRIRVAPPLTIPASQLAAATSVLRAALAA